MNIPSNITTLLAGILLTLISLWIGQNHGLMPVQASEEASWVDGLFNTMMTIGTGLFLLVQGILIYSIFKFRQRPGDDTDGPPIEGNIPLEILWTSIPAIIVLGLGVYSFDVYNSMGGLDPMASHESHSRMAHVSGAAIAAPLPGTDTTPSASPAKTQVALGIGANPTTQGKPPELVVNVLGLQFAWIFTYPESGVTTSELHLPTNRDVQLNITAQDVIHSFWIPQFRLKQDAIPGRPSELRLTAQTPGTYPIVCAELCGSYHGGMRTQAIVETPEAFETWLQSQIASTQTLDQAVATKPADLPPSEFLAPYAAEMGIASKTLEHVHHAAMITP